MTPRSLVLQFGFVIAFASALWGPKLGGFLDLMVLLPALLLIVLVASARLVIPVGFYVASASIASMVVVWVAISVLINGAVDPQGVLRSVRALIGSLVIVPLFYFAASRQVFSVGEAFVLLIAVLFLNTAVIYAQVLFVPLQDILAPLWGFDKTVRAGRAFGLTAGYDSAGYMAAFLAASVLSASLAFRSWAWFLFFLVCSAAVGFTSRTSMLLLGVFIIVVWLLSGWRGNGVRLAATAVGGVVAFVWFILPRLTAGVSELALLTDHGDHDFSADYAETSLVVVLDRMIVFPQGLWGWLFGSGLIVPWSDIGYVRVLHLGGAPLLALMVAFYLQLFWAAHWSGRKIIKLGQMEPDKDKWVGVWLVITVLLLLLMLVGNLKNLYFFARGYHELFVIVSTLMLGFCKAYVMRVRPEGGSTAYYRCDDA